MNYRWFQYLFVFMAATSLFVALAGRAQSVIQASAQRLDVEAIDAYMADWMQRVAMPGAAIGIVRGDQVVYTRGYGIADNAGRAVTPQTPFLIASLSKSFTALGVMQLVDEGKIDLDAPVQTYLPWFQVADEQASARITVRHLLNQTSGFSQRWGYVRNLNTDPSQDALEKSVRALSKESLNAPPGTAFEYSNTNYDVLGLIIEAVSGQSYGSFIRERVFTPLEMRHSYTSLNDARAGSLSSGYYPFFGIRIAYDRLMPYSQVTIPSAGLFSSAEDMSRYLIAHLNQGEYQGTLLVSPGGAVQLHTPAVPIGGQSGYAMGWVVFPFTAAVKLPGDPVPTAISHGGDWAGFQSMMLIIPDHDLGIVVLMNQSVPLNSAAQSNVIWNLALLALEIEPVEFPEADFLAQNARWLLAGILALLGASLLWSLGVLRRLSRSSGSHPAHARAPVAQMLLLALIDLVLAGSLLFIQLPQESDTLWLALRFRPDIGLLYLLLLGFTLGWGTLRTFLFLRQIKTTRVAPRVG